MSDNDTDPVCPNCHIPLRVLISVNNDQCADVVACLIRRQILERGPIHILSPEGVTKIEAIKNESY